MMIRAFANRDKETAAMIMKQNWIRPMREVYQVLDEVGRIEPKWSGKGHGH